MTEMTSIVLAGLGLASAWLAWSQAKLSKEIREIHFYMAFMMETLAEISKEIEDADGE